ncbi:16S rRNA (cytosine1402-N4)-methyltransferase [Allochromatium warmingii]|uniref:Ribosomal RNA small subunit methyltransferase H n=1 Tax=Allochromatium warmingii TaxID=61595 RepID=A0A1H3C5W9_ALLWA|nr:16S rRNA (cytosine(1402)-N(4))-methyltransferase RsmH [Allochromatium warmingii]SDX49572.1 16S rRNA (cytosine1402-N4)-methyltransferase [Allochromatium warmingii]
MSHTPVLLEETVSALQIQSFGRYVDGTFGRGGHSRALLSRLGQDGRVLGLDRDPEAVAVGAQLAAEDARFQIQRGSFADISALLTAAEFARPLNGLLLDLGVSSPQLDTPERGFSFKADGPLDMRMDPHSGESAADWLARADHAEIATVIREFGEERFANRIARAICETRQHTPLVTTAHLAELIAQAVPTREPGKHPATRTFQALRIQVNGELEALCRCLNQVCELLAPGGRLAVISFHSLEDRLVKRFIRRETKGPELPKGVPARAVEMQGRLRPIGKAIRPTEREAKLNPRARSAVLRVAERLPHG